MTRSKKLRVLRELYARIPEVHCKGLCVAACTSIPIAPIELEQIEDVAAVVTSEMDGLPVPSGTVMLGLAPGARCQLLLLGRCSAYDRRPTICRLFGAAEGIRCRHGCEPERMMTDREASEIVEGVASL